MPYQPRATTDNPYGPQVSFRTEDVLPPSAFYVSLDDVLFFAALSQIPSYGLTIAVRMLLPDGTIKIENYQTAAANQISATVLYQIPPVEGYLLGITVQLNQNTSFSVWVQCEIVRGLAPAPIVSKPPSAGMCLMQGYIHGADVLCWPSSPVNEPGTGAGAVRNITLTAAAGQEWKLINSGVSRYLVQSVNYAFSTSAAAGNRSSQLVVLDPAANGVMRYSTNASQAPSTTLGFHYFPDAPLNAAAAGDITAPISLYLYLPGGWTLQSSTPGLAAGDQYSAISVQVQEWAGLTNA